MVTLHARLLRDHALQFDFNGVESNAPIKPPGWLIGLIDALGKGFAAAAPLLEAVFWVGLALCLTLVLWLVLREALGARFPRRSRPRAAGVVPTDWRPEPRRARALLENADQLAAQGLFDQAVRQILTRGIEDIEERRPRQVGPALTAREIARLEAVPPAARGPFTRIADIVELSAFAGRPIGEAAFGQCRAAYEAFAFPNSWA